jgi:hypothetical protein
LKMLTETLLIFLVSGRFSPVSTPHWMQKKTAKAYMLPAALNIIFFEERWLSGSIFMIESKLLGTLKNITRRKFRISV